MKVWTFQYFFFLPFCLFPDLETEKLVRACSEKIHRLFIGSDFRTQTYIPSWRPPCLYANDQSRPYSEAGWATQYTLEIDKTNLSIVGGVIGTGECSTDATEDRNIVNMSVVGKDAPMDKEEVERVFYKEAFEAFDWNRNGRIPTSVSQL